MMIDLLAGSSPCQAFFDDKDDQIILRVLFKIFR